MRKKLALLLAGVMVAAVVPFSTAMAGTKNYVSNVPTVQKNDVFFDGTSNTRKAPDLVIKDENGDIKAAKAKGEDVLFTLELDGAEWTDKMTGTFGGATVTPIDESMVSVKLDGVPDEYRIPMYSKIKNKGDITVTVDGKDSAVSSGTYTFAVAISGSATAKIKDKVSIPEDGAELKNITISETAPGALNNGEEIVLKLSKGFEFDFDNFDNLIYGAFIPVIKDSVGEISKPYRVYDSDGNLIKREIRLYVKESKTKAMEYVLEKLVVVPTKNAKPGDVAEITISGAGMTKTTLEVGTYTDYGVKVTLFDEEKDVPEFYAGEVFNAIRNKDDKVTLSVLISETVANTINSSRKITFKFPEGIKVVDQASGGIDGTGVWFEKDSDGVVDVDTSNVKVDVDGNEVTIKGLKFDETKKSKVAFNFNLAISPNFEGDVEVTVGGAAIGVEETLTVATVKKPFTVEASVNELAIDYRNVAVSDIVIKEAAPGTFKYDDILKFAVEYMAFEKGMKYEVTEGDFETKKVTADKEGYITIPMKEESAKTAGELTLSNLQLYLDRTLPAGDYDLVVKTRESDTELFDSCTMLSKAAENKPYFDIGEVVMSKGYVKVVTAGRDVDDSTFTTKIVVPVGEKTIKAGEKEIAIDVPAFINADGYTMMPLRAVVEALSGTAIVTWDGDTKTATVLFGARVISMTIGQKNMIINGVGVAMLAAPVIVESRTFLPLRDLGYALGLNESQVNWDSATKTATLN